MNSLKNKKVLDLVAIETLIRVVECGSMTRAAEELGVSQSFVSKKVAFLEELLGGPLFLRSKYGVHLHPNAADFYESSVRLFNSTQAFREANAPTDESFRVSLGASSAPSTRLIPKLMVDFYRGNPEYSLSLTVGSTTEIIRAVLNGSLDICVVGRKVRDSAIYCDYFCDDELCLVVSSDNVLAPQSINSFNELRKVPLVIQQHDSATVIDLNSCLSHYGGKLTDLNVKIRCGLAESTVATVLNSDLAAITSRLSIQDYLESKMLREVRLTSIKFPRSFFLLANKRSLGKLGVANVFEYLKKICGSLEITDYR